MENGDSGSPKHDIDLIVEPDDVHVPDKLATHGPLLEALPGLRKDFSSYYQSQLTRIKAEDDTVELSPQESFAEESSFFCKVVDNVAEAIDAQPGRPVIALFDVDENIGRIPENAKTNTIRLPGFENVPDDELSEQQYNQLRQLRLQNTYESLQMRPAFVHAVNYLKEKYGSHVRFGILTTKEQAGLDRYLAPMLSDLCPGAFQKDLVMSCKDGAAEGLIPEVFDKIRAAEESGGPINFADALEGLLDRSPEGRAVITERVVKEHTEALTVYDTKLLMMIRILEKLRKEGSAQMHEEPPDGEHQEDWYESVHPDAAVILFDDAEQPAVLPDDSSLRYIVTQRFRLPDDLI